MTWPTPAPGLVIRYAYLWEEAARAGREEGEKDRPCAVLLVHREEDGRIRVYALPITHSAPAEPGDGIEIPTVVKEHLGLDDARSWVILTEANVFYWPRLCGNACLVRAGGGVGVLPAKQIGQIGYQARIAWSRPPTPRIEITRLKL